jgi:hypothetical protein
VIGGAAYRAGQRHAQDGYDDGYDDGYAPPPPAPPPPGPTQAGPSDIEQITQLAQLHDAGALTDEEFTAAKAKILG